MVERKKLIEVALPLDAINVASAKEKSIRQGHPSTLHLWWSRKPLAAARAVLFASLVDDPSSHPNFFPTEETQERERQRLFNLIREMVQWENTSNPKTWRKIHDEIRQATNGKPPSILDPFCGGGSIPLEAQRLGLESFASDLNPVAVLITKALIEIPPRFADQPPVNPDAQRNIVAHSDWPGASGLASDVRFYGQWMRDEAEKRLRSLYPPVALPKESGGGQAKVIAWLWVRTVTCPNPACGAQMPLTNKFSLSTKKGKQVWIEPQIDRTSAPPSVRFTVRSGTGAPQEGTVNRRGGICICCGVAVPFDHIRAEGKSGKMGAQLLAIVAEGRKGRIYLDPKQEHETVVMQSQPQWKPDFLLPHNPRDFKTPNYGLMTFADLFTPRQLVAMGTFTDLVRDAREKVRHDAMDIGMSDDNVPFTKGGTGALAYADSVVTYLSFAVDRLAMTGNSLVRWNPVGEKAQHAFGRQALPIIWDYAEPNFFGTSTGSVSAAVELVADPLSLLGGITGQCLQQDAAKSLEAVNHPLICTDPPYYDNIGYADLSDFFYVWLRHCLSDVYPELFTTLLTPKAAELVATPYRFDGNAKRAEEFFEQGLGDAFARMREVQHPDYPMTVFYAFKQSESDENGSEETTSGNVAVASTGWETMLTGLLRAGFSIVGTWPIRTEMGSRMIGQGANALASSIVLVCRLRPQAAPIAERREFRNALRDGLPDALRKLQQGNIAPVDLAQAAIGPGMAIFSRYRQVVEPDGTPMRVRTALQLINESLDEVLAEQEGDYDAETRWAVAWYEQYGMDEGAYGSAETLSRAKNASVDGLVASGIVKAGQGKVRLLRRDELPLDWNPATDKRLTVWEVAQYLIRTLENDGEDAAAALLARCGAQGAVARELAYRLYVSSDRKGWTQEAFSYNGLVIAWPDLTTKMRQQDQQRDEQTALPFD